MRTFNQISQSAVYREDDISVSLTVCGGSYGGGSEVLVVYTKIPSAPSAPEITRASETNTSKKTNSLYK